MGQAGRQRMERLCVHDKAPWSLKPAPQCTQCTCMIAGTHVLLHAPCCSRPHTCAAARMHAGAAAGGKGGLTGAREGQRTHDERQVVLLVRAGAHAGRAACAVVQAQLARREPYGERADDKAEDRVGRADVDAALLGRVKVLEVCCAAPGDVVNGQLAWKGGRRVHRGDPGLDGGRRGWRRRGRRGRPRRGRGCKQAQQKSEGSAICCESRAWMSIRS